MYKKALLNLNLTLLSTDNNTLEIIIKKNPKYWKIFRRSLTIIKARIGTKIYPTEKRAVTMEVSSSFKAL